MSPFRNAGRTITSFFILFFACNGKAHNNTDALQPSPVQERVLTDGLDNPWEILWGSDNFIWMTEREGTVSRVNPSTGARQVVYRIPDVTSRGEGGLLGMALHPNFLKTPYVYVVYDYDGSGGYRGKVVRFTYNGTTLTAPKTLLDGIVAAGIHNGSRLQIFKNHLFITTGDASNKPSAQNTGTLNGKVLRIGLDGSIPKDNPFPDNPVWSWGHRNAQGLVVMGNKLVEAEHGPESDDELNIIERGRNYGWPNVTGLCDGANEKEFCNENKMHEPFKTWTPTAAVSGVDFYNSDAIPEWKNSLLVATLKNSRIYQLKLNAEQTEVTGSEEFFRDGYGRIRDICVAPNGMVYFCTSNGGNDKIVAVRGKK
jgi:glucose/arabinose dehydrogenase